MINVMQNHILVLVIDATLHQIILLNGIKVRVFFGKNIEKKHLCRRDKNYY